MIIFPAIDLKEGHCVRLEKGDFNKKTIYSNNPVDIAKQFEKQGATSMRGHKRCTLMEVDR